MKVTLVAMTKPVGTGNAEDVVERSAAVCYDSKPTATHRIAAACARSGHMSVWEHISFTFHVEEVSRALLAQLSRHRHISLSVRSQRYNSEKAFDYMMPKTVEDNASARYEYIWIMNRIEESYDVLQADHIPNEDARAVLPNACYTELYLTVNARALVEISRLRLCTRAQAEIRELFQMIKEVLKGFSPMVAGMMVPKCEQVEGMPFCTEGKGCGRHPMLKDVYKGE